MDIRPETLKSKLRSNWITRDQANNALKSAWPALKLALTVLDKTLGAVPIPGLKGAVGGILVLSKAEEVSARVTGCALVLVC